MVTHLQINKKKKTKKKELGKGSMAIARRSHVVFSVWLDVCSVGCVLFAPPSLAQELTTLLHLQAHVKHVLNGLLEAVEVVVDKPCRSEHEESLSIFSKTDSYEHTNVCLPCGQRGPRATLPSHLRPLPHTHTRVGTHTHA